MGAEIKSISGEVDRDTDGRTGGTGRTGSTESASTTDSRTTKRTGGTAGGSTGGTAGGTAGGQTEEKELSRLVVLDEDQKKKDEKNARRRERYAERKANGEQPKPRKTKKKKVETVDTTQLNLMIGSVAGIIASRPNCEHWALSQKEIESITTPLGNILSESDMFKTLGEHSNQIALVTACMTVFAPRLLVTYQKEKEKKKNVKVIKQPVSINKPAGQNKKSDNGNDRQSTTSSSNTVYDEPFYGIPLC